MKDLPDHLKRLNEDSMSALKDYLCPYRDEFSISLGANRELSDVYPRMLIERLDRIRAKTKRVTTTVIAQ